MRRLFLPQLALLLFLSPWWGRPLEGCINGIELILDDPSFPSDFKASLSQMNFDLQALARAEEVSYERFRRLAGRFVNSFSSFVADYGAKPPGFLARRRGWGMLLERCRRMVAELARCVADARIDDARVLVGRIRKTMDTMFDADHVWKESAVPKDAPLYFVSSGLSAFELEYHPFKAAFMALSYRLSSTFEGKTILVGGFRGANPESEIVPALRSLMKDSRTRILSPFEVEGLKDSLEELGLVSLHARWFPLAPEALAFFRSRGIDAVLTGELLEKRTTRRFFRDELDPEGKTFRSEVKVCCRLRAALLSAADGSFLWLGEAAGDFVSKEDFRRDSGGPVLVNFQEVYIPSS